MILDNDNIVPVLLKSWKTEYFSDGETLNVFFLNLKISFHIKLGHTDLGKKIQHLFCPNSERPWVHPKSATAARSDDIYIRVAQVIVWCFHNKTRHKRAIYAQSGTSNWITRMYIELEKKKLKVVEIFWKFNSRSNSELFSTWVNQNVLSDSFFGGCFIFTLKMPNFDLCQTNLS